MKHDHRRGHGPCPACCIEQFEAKTTRDFEAVYAERYEGQFDTGEGLKLDAGKPRTDLLPFDALEGVSRVLDYGANKYAARNWEKGLAWCRLLGATLRHLFRWASGEDLDPESGLPHLDHAACSVLMLSASVKRGIGTDDRRVKPWRTTASTCSAPSAPKRTSS